MRETGINNGRLIGFVQVQVGSKVFALPVQAVRFDRARGTSPRKAGFFSDEAGQFGIVVDEDASPRDVERQIADASADAVKHISRKYLN